VFRQAMAIDERRRMFRLKPWDDPQSFMSNPFAPDTARRRRTSCRVWFAGVHGDIGGSYKEAQSRGLEISAAVDDRPGRQVRLTVNPRTVNHLAWGRSRKKSPFQYVAPDYKADIHNSMNFAWRLLEGIPKKNKYKEWPKAVVARPYIPCCEPRFIPEGAVIHESAVLRSKERADYKPENMPKTWQTYDMPTPPPEHVAEQE
jgi:hypothetical protein